MPILDSRAVHGALTLAHTLISPDGYGQRGGGMSATGTTAVNRVPRHTAANVNERIREHAIESVANNALNGGTIERRLRQLREWDVERGMETGSATLSLVGLGLGFAVSPWWYLLTLGVQMFFLQHALQGWCPPLPIFRRLGWRRGAASGPPGVRGGGVGLRSPGAACPGRLVRRVRRRPVPIGTRLRSERNKPRRELRRARGAARGVGVCCFAPALRRRTGTATGHVARSGAGGQDHDLDAA
jgi:hypothetical protein